jgi:hypothetical protein
MDFRRYRFFSESLRNIFSLIYLKLASPDLRISLHSFGLVRELLTQVLQELETRQPSNRKKHIRNRTVTMIVTSWRSVCMA